VWLQRAKSTGPLTSGERGERGEIAAPMLEATVMKTRYVEAREKPKW
jgi:hypothetical protein